MTAATEERTPVKAKHEFDKHLLVKNAIALYGVQIGRKLIPLASIPYLARVLGPEGWGKVAFVTALAEMIGIFIEFGFNISGTRRISHHRHDIAERAETVAGILLSQVFIACLSVCVAVAVAPFLPVLPGHPVLLLCGLTYGVFQGLVPIWYFQGMERLRLVAGLELTAKTCSLGALFLFVHHGSDLWRVLLIQAITPGAVAICGIGLALRENPVRQWRISYARAALREGWSMFLYRAGETLYGTANSFLLGLYAPPVLVGYFSSAEKISKAAGGLLNPIRESLYPRLSFLMFRDRQAAQKLAAKGALLMAAGGFALSLALFLFADPLIHHLLGANFEQATRVLRILSPLPLLLAMSFSAGQLWLLPLRRDSAINRSIYGAGLLNLLLSFLLAPTWGHTGMAWTVLLSEAFAAISLCAAIAISFRYPAGGRIIAAP